MRNGHDLERTPCRTGVVSRARRATDSTTFIGRQGEETMGTIVPETQGWVRDLEAVVGRIRAVAAARVVVDANDNIETIHVLAGRTRTAAQNLADSQSVGAARLDLDIDPGRVLIAYAESWPGAHGPRNRSLPTFSR